jgi:putative membrane protein
MSDQISGSAPELGTNTRLAYERTRVAYERTMMAWVRTGTSLITFGFSVYKFFQLEVPSKGMSAPLIGSREFALGLILIGLMSLLLGTIEHQRDLRAMRAQYPGMPSSMSVVVAILIAALGLIALLAVILRA